MALQYFLYDTDYGNTIVDRSNTSFAPSPPYAEIHIDYFIPEIQPLYFYRESGGTIVYNTNENIDAYLSATELPPTPEGNVTYGEFTGTTAILSASTANLYATKVNLSGDTMTGSLSTTSNLFANGSVTGSSVYGSVWIHSPVICATTRVQSPIISGSTCSIAPITIGTSCVCSPRILGSVSVCSPIVSGSTCLTGTISCATTRMQSPIVCGSTCSTSPITCGTTCSISPIIFGSTCVCSPTICSSTCLCSTGTARFTGGVTAASTLNVSGITRIANSLCLPVISTGGTLSDYNVVWNPVTKEVRTISPTGNACVYCYCDRRTSLTNGTTTNATYITSTWTLPAGTYQLEFNALFGNDTSNRCAITCFLIDGAVFGYCNLMKTNDTNVVTTAYVTQDEVLSAASHTFAIVFRQCGGGNAVMRYGTMRVQKIGT